SVDLCSHEIPIESPAAGTKWWQCDGLNPQLANDPKEVLEPLAHPLNTGWVAPVLLGREVDDPFRANRAQVLGDEHLPDVHLTAPSGSLIFLRALGECFLEHEGDALAHDALLVDRIDKGFGRGVQQIALCITDHRKNQSG